MPDLFDCVQIGSMTVKNRLIMPALNLRYCPDGKVNDRTIGFYYRRAIGGVGLIVVGKCLIEEPGYGSSLGIGDDRYIPGLEQLASAIHSCGAMAAAQLGHDGGNVSSKRTGCRVVAPSAIPYRTTGEIPHELSIDEIEELIDLFAKAAGRAKEADFDAVEVMGHAGNLVSQFLSPLTNFREDIYGGSPQNRMRFGLELTRAIKHQAGQDFPVIFRVSGHDFMPGGNTSKEAIDFCKALEQVGVDAFNVTGGWHESPVPQITMQVPRGAMVYLAQRVKQAVRVPVVACNRITTPELANTIVQNEAADLIGLARVLVADPDWPLKAQSGKSREIRPCIACNQGCMDETFNNRPMRCLVNPEVAEETMHKMQPTVKARRVLVIGGGPAGMEAAYIAAARGHIVSLWEKEPVLGGQLLMAGSAPGREEWHTLRDYLAEALEMYGVDIELSKTVSIKEILSIAPDVLITATGAQPSVPEIPGIESAIHAGDILLNRVHAGRRIAVIGAGATGCETALYMARQGAMTSSAAAFFVRHQAENNENLARCLNGGSKNITIVEAGDKAGVSIGRSTRWIVLGELSRAGVKILTNSRILQINADGLLISRNGIQETILADTVVLAAGVRSNSMLFPELEDKIPELHAVGDAVRPRTVMDAIHEAYRIACTI